MDKTDATEIQHELERIRQRLIDGGCIENESLQIAKIYIESAIVQLDEFMEED